MKKFILYRAREMWLLASIGGLCCPAYFMLIGDPAGVWNAMGWFITVIFFLSMPASVIGAPLVAAVRIAMGGHGTGLFDTYISLLLFIAFGAIQWWWVMPRYLKDPNIARSLSLTDEVLTGYIAEIRTTIDPLRPRSKTPVERVIADERP